MPDEKLGRGIDGRSQSSRVDKTPAWRPTGNMQLTDVYKKSLNNQLSMLIMSINQSATIGFKGTVCSGVTISGTKGLKGIKLS